MKRGAVGFNEWDIKVSGSVLNCKRTPLTDRQLRLFLILDGHARDKPYCWLLNRTLAELSGKHPSKVREALAEMEAMDPPPIARIPDPESRDRVGFVLYLRACPAQPAWPRGRPLAEAAPIIGEAREASRARKRAGEAAASTVPDSGHQNSTQVLKSTTTKSTSSEAAAVPAAAARVHDVPATGAAATRRSDGRAVAESSSSGSSSSSSRGQRSEPAAAAPEPLTYDPDEPPWPVPNADGKEFDVYPYFPALFDSKVRLSRACIHCMFFLIYFSRGRPRCWPTDDHIHISMQSNWRISREEVLGLLEKLQSREIIRCDPDPSKPAGRVIVFRQPPLWLPSQIAKRYGCSTDRVRRLIDRGLVSIAPRTTGGVRYVPADQLGQIEQALRDAGCIADTAVAGAK